LPLKSWAFNHQGHALRAEIWWRFTGWNRKRLYIDHRLAVGKRGRFTSVLPIDAEIDLGKDGKESIIVRFRRRRLGLDMDCEVAAGSGTFAPVQAVSVEKLWRQDDSDPSPSGSSEGQRIAGCLVLTSFILTVAALYIPLLAVGAATQWWQSYRLRRHLRLNGRLLTWKEVEQRMRGADSPCTLILQIGNLAEQRAWWTADDVLARTPLPLLDYRSLIHPARVRHPFIEWCEFHYLSPQSGKAFRVEVPKSVFHQLGSFDRADFINCLQEQYPFLKTAITGYSHGRRKTAAPRLAKILGENLSLALPGLIAALNDGDPTLRRLCLECIRLAGPSAASAMTLLKEKFYFGPWSERYDVAKALTALGPEGEAVLSEAAKLGDPRLRNSAKSALRMARLVGASEMSPKPSAVVISRRPVKFASAEREGPTARNRG
jgi:hypothetical protein